MLGIENRTDGVLSQKLPCKVRGPTSDHISLPCCHKNCKQSEVSKLRSWRCNQLLRENVRL